MTCSMVDITKLSNYLFGIRLASELSYKMNETCLIGSQFLTRLPVFWEVLMTTSMRLLGKLYAKQSSNATFWVYLKDQKNAAQNYFKKTSMRDFWENYAKTSMRILGKLCQNVNANSGEILENQKSD